MKITHLSVLDLRFPTSRDQVGTDAVHIDPDTRRPTSFSKRMGPSRDTG